MAARQQIPWASVDPFLSGSVRSTLLITSFCAALGMTPWIAYLFLTQTASAEAEHLPILHVGISLTIVLFATLTAYFARRRSPVKVVMATTTATLALVIPWFDIGSTQHDLLTLSILFGLVGLAPLFFLSIIAIRGAFHPRNASMSIRPLIPSLINAFAVFVLVVAVVASFSLQSETRVDHLRMVWCGLDVAELVGLFGIAWALLRRSPTVVLFASMTSALLLADGWYDVVGTRGIQQMNAALMAGVELPLSVLAFWLAWCEVAQWPLRQQTGAANGTTSGE